MRAVSPETSVIVIPCLNEADSIARVIADLDGHIPIWVVDGGSTDGTRRIVSDLIRGDGGLSLIDNPGRIQARGVNLAACLAVAAGKTVLIRADAHATYPAGWALCVLSAMSRTGADSVVVPLIATGTGVWQASAALLQRTWMGHGGAPHRKHGTGGWVAHGHHAAMRLDRFLGIGGYDARFDANEDSEFDLRLSSAGGRIWLADDCAVEYLPRRTPISLFRQMYRNGRWRVRTARKHGRWLGLRQVVPILAVALALGGTVTGLTGRVAAFALPACYLGLVCVLSLHAAFRARRAWLAPGVCLLALLSHAGFATGALRELSKLPARTAPRTATDLPL